MVAGRMEVSASFLSWDVLIKTLFPILLIDPLHSPRSSDRRELSRTLFLGKKAEIQILCSIPPSSINASNDDVETHGQTTFSQTVLSKEVSSATSDFDACRMEAAEVDQAPAAQLSPSQDASDKLPLQKAVTSQALIIDDMACCNTDTNVGDSATQPVSENCSPDNRPLSNSAERSRPSREEDGRVSAPKGVLPESGSTANGALLAYIAAKLNAKRPQNAENQAAI